MWSVIGEHGTVEGGTDPTCRLDSAAVEAATGWALKPQGWCRDEACLPHSSDDPTTSDSTAAGGITTWSLEDIGKMLGIKVAADATHRVGVLGHAYIEPLALHGIAPDVELTTLDGKTERLFDHSNGKTMIVAFSSWCGCRYDLPGWQELQDELGEHDFQVVAVAIDESPSDVTEWAEGIDYPVLVDTNRDFADSYGLTNVPAIVWTDEDRHVVRTPTTEFSNDMFTEVHGVESGPHLDAVKKWVRGGEVPDVAQAGPPPAAVLGDAQRQARVEFRLALELLRRGHEQSATQRLALADELAPDDLTIWRAGMKLRGEDTFGAEFFERFVNWQKRTAV